MGDGLFGRGDFETQPDVCQSATCLPVTAIFSHSGTCGDKGPELGIQTKPHAQNQRRDPAVRAGGEPMRGSYHGNNCEPTNRQTLPPRSPDQSQPIGGELGLARLDYRRHACCQNPNQASCTPCSRAQLTRWGRDSGLIVRLAAQALPGSSPSPPLKYSSCPLTAISGGHSLTAFSVLFLLYLLSFCL